MLHCFVLKGVNCMKSIKYFISFPFFLFQMTGAPPGHLAHGHMHGGHAHQAPSGATPTGPSSASSGYGSTAGTPTNTNGSNSSEANSSSTTSTTPGGSAPTCRRHGCSNTVIDPSGSMNGYCSNECVLSQSRDIYNNWSSSASGAAVQAAQCR